MAQTDHQQPLDDELLSAYLDGELAEKQREQVEQRLREDPDAQQLVAQLRSVSETVRHLPKHELGIDLRDRILSQAAVQPRAKLPESRSPRRWVYAATALAAALLLMIYQGPAHDDQQQVAGSAPRPTHPDVVARVDAVAQDKSESLPAADELSAALAQNLLAEGSTQPPQVELIGEQLMGDAPLEHLHVHLKPEANAGTLQAFNRLLEEHGVAIRSGRDDQDEAPTDTTEAAMILVEAPLLTVRQLVADCRQQSDAWADVTIRRQSDSAPALSFFKPESQLTASQSALSMALAEDQPRNAWASHLGRGQVPEDNAVVSGLSAGVHKTGSLGDSQAIDPNVQAAQRAAVRVLFILHPVAE